MKYERWNQRLYAESVTQCYPLSRRCSWYSRWLWLRERVPQLKAICYSIGNWYRKLLLFCQLGGDIDILPGQEKGWRLVVDTCSDCDTCYTFNWMSGDKTVDPASETVSTSGWMFHNFTALPPVFCKVYLAVDGSQLILAIIFWWAGQGRDRDRQKFMT